MRRQLEEEKEGIERMIRETEGISKTIEQSVGRPSICEKESESQIDAQQSCKSLEGRKDGPPIIIKKPSGLKQNDHSENS